MKATLAIFDLDGTLIDSRGLIHEAMQIAYRRAGLTDPGYDRIRHVIGLGLSDAFTALEPHADQRLHEALVGGYREAFRILRGSEVHREAMYDGASELLRALKSEGWALGVATGKSRRGLSAVFRLHRLDRYLDIAYCADDGPGKPDPFMVRANLAAAGVGAVDAVMIGDATHDITMARAAGVRALGVTWGFATGDEMRLAGADELHADFASLHQSLAAFQQERAM